MIQNDKIGIDQMGDCFLHVRGIADDTNYEVEKHINLPGLTWHLPSWYHILYKFIMKSSIPPDIKRLSWLSKLLDSQFRVPGTNFRFGLDPLIGLIPGVGDFISFVVSSLMLATLARNGASGNVLARMILNVVLDTLIGAIPLAGDLFDFVFKSNQRNLRLLQEHYTEGRHRGGAWKVIVPVLLVLLVCMTGVIWLVYKLISLLF